MTGPRSRKARNLQADPRVALSPTAADKDTGLSNRGSAGDSPRPVAMSQPFG
jgi:hypothetical protein